MYKSRVNKAFDNIFEPVNERLATYGFQLEQTVNDGCDNDGNVYFEGFREQVNCNKQATLNLPSYSTATVTKWQTESPGFARYLESQGWVKRSRTQSLSDLFNGRDGEQTLNVTYTKDYKKIQCELMIGYYPWENDSDKAWANESCERQFVTFGGPLFY
jgi:hypothetical protein